MMQPNRVKGLYLSGSVAIGTYGTLASTRAVEAAAVAGLDFVRFDHLHSPYSYESLENRVQAAYSYGITPWVRAEGDPLVITRVLALGVQAITVPSIATRGAAQAAVAAVHHAPLGAREAYRPLRAQGLTRSAYLEWTLENLIVACQIEDAEGLANCAEIVRVDGVDVIQTGRNDLAASLGVPGELSHPIVVEAERRIVATALEAGRAVSVHCGLTEDGIATALHWIDEGVQIVTFETDFAAIVRSLSHATGQVRDLHGARSQ